MLSKMQDRNAETAGGGEGEMRDDNWTGKKGKTDCLQFDKKICLNVNEETVPFLILHI
jgi:hypothetical protein